MLLCFASTIEAVQLLVEGSVPEAFPGGTPGDVIFTKERGINLEPSERAAGSEDSRTAMLYFCTVLGDNHIFYVPVSRSIAGSGEIHEMVIQELLEGPQKDSFLFSELPPDTKLLNSKLYEDILMVNFSQEILNYKGPWAGKKYLCTAHTNPYGDSGHRKGAVIGGRGKIILDYGTSFQEPLSDHNF